MVVFACGGGGEVGGWWCLMVVVVVGFVGNIGPSLLVEVAVIMVVIMLVVNNLRSIINNVHNDSLTEKQGIKF